MERQVKERLIGAAVLVAIAVILIPELLSGPGTEHRPPAATPTRNEQGIKTYQFDLNQPRSSGQFTAAPPPELSTPQPEPEKESEAKPAAEVTAATPPPVTPEPEREAVPPAEEQPRPQPSPEKAPAPNPPPAPAQRSSAASTPGWAVQLGSFADAERASHLVERLRAAGHNAYLVPLRRADGKTLQRVRIGPYGERAQAEAALKRVAGEAKGAAVVSQP
ncbi:MAG: SPOR domain-containing protein [Steroidobacteraceae bacterium]